MADCNTCCRRKPWTAEPAVPMRNNLASRPGECWAMDIVGPLPTTRNGHRYILTMCDVFTRWAEAIALPDQRAPTIARAVVDRVIAAHGVPEQILTDQGQNFDSQLMHHVCQLLGIHKSRTTAYHPQGNGHCERFNGTLSDIISSLVSKNGGYWDEVLSLALFLYRTKTHSSIGSSPFQMTYGRQPRRIQDTTAPSLTIEHVPTNRDDYIIMLQRNILEFHHLANEKQITHVQCQQRPTLPALVEGEEVFLKKNVRTGKFDDRFSAPFAVTQTVDDQNVVIATDAGPYRCHRGRIKLRPRPRRSTRYAKDFLEG